MKNKVKIAATEKKGGEINKFSVETFSENFGKTKKERETKMKIVKINTTVEAKENEITEENAREKIMEALTSGKFQFSSDSLKGLNKYKMVFVLPEEDKASYKDLGKMFKEGKISQEDFVQRFLAKALKEEEEKNENN